MLVLRVVRCERRTSLTVNAGCWHALPMGIHATLMLAPGCSPWRPKSEPTTSPDAVTDGDGGGRHAARESSLPICAPPALSGDAQGTTPNRSICTAFVSANVQCGLPVVGWQDAAGVLP